MLKLYVTFSALFPNLFSDNYIITSIIIYYIFGRSRNQRYKITHLQHVDNNMTGFWNSLASPFFVTPFLHRATSSEDVQRFITIPVDDG